METRYGLSDKSIDKLVKQINVILANNHVLYVKTLNYHWNIQDPRFYSLHAFFQEQYEGLAEHGDLLAERIRQMGRTAPGSLREFLELATLNEAPEKSTADQMISDLADSHEAAIQHIRAVIAEADELGDPGTSDTLVEVVRAHEKTAWMLRAHL